MTKNNSTKFKEERNVDTLAEAQHDMRVAYLCGSSGVIASGLVWLVSGLVAYFVSTERAIWTLLIGGVFIHPIGVVLDKILGASGTHSSKNPLGPLALEGTLFMIMCIPLAYGLSLQHAEWFFQGMLLIIGGRYLTFATLYGVKIYWILGACLGVLAYFLFSTSASAYVSALSGATTEILFGTYLLVSSKRAGN